MAGEPGSGEIIPPTFHVTDALRVLDRTFEGKAEELARALHDAAVAQTPYAELSMVEKNHGSQMLLSCVEAAMAAVLAQANSHRDVARAAAVKVALASLAATAGNIIVAFELLVKVQTTAYGCGISIGAARAACARDRRRGLRHA